MIFANNYGNAVTLEELKSIKLKRPKEAGGYWKGVPHFELAQAVRESIRPTKGVCHFMREGYFLSKDKKDIAGYCTIRRVGGEVEAGLAFMSSNARRLGTKFYLGGIVDPEFGVGDVPSLIDGVSLVVEEARTLKHTSGASLETLCAVVDSVVPDLAKLEARLEAVVAELKDKAADDGQAAGYFMTMGREELMPWSRIGDVVDIWERMPKIRRWDLFRAFSKVNQRNSPMTQLSNLHGFLKVLQQA